jgi:hypothetical protein
MITAQGSTQTSNFIHFNTTHITFQQIFLLQYSMQYHLKDSKVPVNTKDKNIR